jgi:hypothetical protein
MAQSNVYSLNVVGYVNKVFTGGGKYSAVANPLNTSSNTLGSLLGTLPPGSLVLKWNAAIADYDTYLKQGFGIGWNPASGVTTSLNPGEGVLIHIDGADLTNTFVGEVLQGTLTTSFGTGYTLVGNQVPDSGPVNTLGLGPNPGDLLLKWNLVTQDFDPFLKTGFGIGWSPSVPSIDVAEGFFINAGSPTNWVRNFTVQ